MKLSLCLRGQQQRVVCWDRVYLGMHFFSGSSGLHVIMRLNHPDWMTIPNWGSVIRSNKPCKFFWGITEFKKSLGFLGRAGIRGWGLNKGTSEDHRDQQAAELGYRVEAAIMPRGSSISTACFIRNSPVIACSLSEGLLPALSIRPPVKPDKLFIMGTNPFNIWWRFAPPKFSDRHKLWFSVSEVSLTSWNLFTNARLRMK